VIETTTLKAEDLRPPQISQPHLVPRFCGTRLLHRPQPSDGLLVAVYCVRAGESVAEHPDSGVLRFLDTRQGANAFTDPAILPLKRPYAVRLSTSGSPPANCAIPIVRIPRGRAVLRPRHAHHRRHHCWFAP